MFKKFAKLPLKVVVILIVVAIAVVTVGVVMIVAASLGDASRFEYALKTDGTYEISDVKNTYRGGIFAKDTITVPESYKGVPVTSIKNLNLQKTKNVIVSEGIESIGLSAFYKSSVVSVQLPDSLKSLGNNAFAGCSQLTTINLPNSLTTIGNGAFKDCTSLENITLPNRLKAIGKDVFNGCLKLKPLTLPASVTSIGETAFRGCAAFTTITLPDSVTEIGNSAFEGCAKLTSVTMPANLTKIGNSAFKGCAELLSLDIPAGVTELGQNIIENCKKLTEVNIAAENTSFVLKDSIIYDAAEETIYAAMCNVTTVTISETVTKIVARSFIGTSLESAQFANTSGWKAGRYTPNLSDAAAAAQSLLTGNTSTNDWTYTAPAE